MLYLDNGCAGHAIFTFFLQKRMYNIYVYICMYICMYIYTYSSSSS